MKSKFRGEIEESSEKKRADMECFRADNAVYELGRVQTRIRSFINEVDQVVFKRSRLQDWANPANHRSNLCGRRHITTEIGSE